MRIVNAPVFRAFISELDAAAASMPQSGWAPAAAALSRLLVQDSWLPEPFRQPSIHNYRQYLLHRTIDRSLAVVAFVWGPGQSTPIHDHGVWGLVGVLQGAEIEQRYVRQASGVMKATAETRFAQGEVAMIHPEQDIHSVRNAFAGQVSISIHVYGGDIGNITRRSYDEDGSSHAFTSGYDAEVAP